jgi:hypothetical protein
MKKRLLFLLAFVFPALTFSQLTNEQIASKMSETFSTACVRDMLNAAVVPREVFPKLDFTKLSVDYQGKFSSPTYYIPAFDKGKLLGVVHVARVDAAKTKTVNNCGYVMTWRDYSTVTLNANNKLEGVVKCHDLNHGGMYFASYTITNGLVTSWIFDQQLLDKNTGADYCDRRYGNGNGNLGYWECYRCITGICSSSSNCNFLYWFSNVLGVGAGSGPVASEAISVSCIILSIIY